MPSIRASPVHVKRTRGWLPTTAEEILDLSSSGHHQQVERANDGEDPSRSEPTRQPLRRRMIDLDPRRTVGPVRLSVALRRKRGDAEQCIASSGSRLIATNSQSGRRSAMFRITSRTIAASPRLLLVNMPSRPTRYRRDAFDISSESGRAANPAGSAVSDIHWSRPAHRFDQVAHDIALAPVREPQRERRGPEPL